MKSWHFYFAMAAILMNRFTPDSIAIGSGAAFLACAFYYMAKDK